MKPIIFILCLMACIVSNQVFSQTNYPGQGIIGKGYNVFGEFANNKSVQRFKLFDFSQMSLEQNQFGQNLPELIVVDNISDHIISTIEGSSIEEYSKHLSENIGLSGNALFFKASIDAQFKDSYESNEHQFFYTYMDVNTKWRTSIDLRNIDKLLAYLDSQFKKDLDSLNPKELFDLYGTHFVSSAYLGGRIDFTSVSNLTNEISKTDIGLALKAKYGQINGHSSNYENSEIILNTTNTTTRLNVIGGKSEYTNNISNPEQYSKWAEGIVQDPVLCGFDDKSLVPIWFLTKDESRKKELQDYFNSIIIPMYPYPTFFKKDPILDGNEFIGNYQLYVKGFSIIKDCDEADLLTSDEDGDFQYSLDIFVNDEIKGSVRSPQGKFYGVWGGNELTVNYKTQFKIPLNKGTKIKIKYTLHDYDEFSENDVLGNSSITHFFPFAINQLYNYKEAEQFFWKQNLYHSSSCNANLFYQIKQILDPTAVAFGDQGWTEYEQGKYDECLNYSRKALAIDNSIWYVQFNVALIYLIKQNPNAYNKYQDITNHCADLDVIKAAYQDVLNHELKFGTIQNSEAIKLLLKSKLNL